MKGCKKILLTISAFVCIIMITVTAAYASGAAPKLEASNAADGIRLTWDRCEGVYYYEVYRQTEKKGKNQLLSKVQEELYVDTEAAEGKTYYYTVKPVYTDYNSGTSSARVEAYRLGSAFISKSASQRNGIYISWKAVKNAKGYRVYRMAEGDSEWLTVSKLGANEREFTDEKINPGRNYTYCVKAFMGEFEGAAGNEKQLHYISYPTFRSLTNTENGITLKWEGESEAAYYMIYKKTGEAGEFKALALLDASYTEYEDKTASSGETCSYYICSADEQGRLSSYDRELSLKCIKKSVITAATNVKNGIKIYWSRSEGCQGYAIFKKSEDQPEWKLRGIVYGDSNLSAVDSQVSNKKTYTYTVRAFWGKNLAAYEDEGATLRFYSAPQKLTFKADAKKGNTLKWEKTEGAKCYAVYRKDAKNDWTVIGFANDNSYVDSTAVSTEKYAYCVKVYEGSVLCSDLSDVVYSYKK